MIEEQLFIIRNEVFVDKIHYKRKLTSELFLVYLDCHNRMMIDNYCRRLGVYSYILPLTYDYWVIDKYGQIINYIKEENFEFISIKWFSKTIDMYRQFKKSVNFKTYQLKQLIRFCNFKCKLNEFDY